MNDFNHFDAHLFPGCQCLTSGSNHSDRHLSISLW